MERLRRDGAGPQAAFFTACLNTTTRVPQHLRPLLAYDNLNELPKLDTGIPGVAVIPYLLLGDVLETRLVALLATGQLGLLADETLLALEITQRLDRPWNLIDASACFAVEQVALRWVTFCAAQGLFNEEQIGRLVANDWPELPGLTRLLEGECAAVAQIWAVYGNQPRSALDRMMSEGDRAYRTGWFSWASTRRGRRRSLDHPQKALSELTSTVEQTVSRLDAARRGQTPDLPDGDVGSDALYEQLTSWLALRPLFVLKLKAALRQATGGRFERKTEGEATTLHLREVGLDAATLKALDSYAGKELRAPLALKP